MPFRFSTTRESSAKDSITLKSQSVETSKKGIPCRCEYSSAVNSLTCRKYNCMMICRKYNCIIICRKY
ncbi:hypothetical protein EB796_020081 [Bugula neritina]|uniref:Uncharacterized protein n=1 Tax=Bugula neritina TaxID=10212 RepID=A0A7J7J5W2_BUGNE|nr:hypothetical protein EB796_020081 [Bugula neritina]